MLSTRLLCLDDQAHEHAHDHHQLVLSLSGRAEFEVNGRGGEVADSPTARSPALLPLLFIAADRSS